MNNQSLILSTIRSYLTRKVRILWRQLSRSMSKSSLRVCTLRLQTTFKGSSLKGARFRKRSKSPGISPASSWSRKPETGKDPMLSADEDERYKLDIKRESRPSLRRSGFLFVLPGLVRVLLNESHFSRFDKAVARVVERYCLDPTEVGSGT